MKFLYYWHVLLDDLAICSKEYPKFFIQIISSICQKNDATKGNEEKLNSTRFNARILYFKYLQMYFNMSQMS